MRISDWSSDVCSSDLDCLCISLELRLQRFAESNGLGSNDMHQRTALQTGEYRRIDLLGNGFIIGQHHAATRTAQSLVRRGCDHMRVTEGRRVRSARDQASEVDRKSTRLNSSH